MHRFSTIIAATAAFLFASPASMAYGQELQIEKMKQTRARPLFSITRRPPPPVLAPAPFTVPINVSQPVQEIEAPVLSLLGVVISANEKVVIVRKPQDPKPIRLVQGDEIDGWQVISIEPRTVILKHSERSIVLTFSPPANVHVTDVGPQ